MSDDLMDEIKSRLIEAARDKCFLSVLYQESRKDRENMGGLLSDLHNSGQIDLVAEFLQLTKNKAGVDFFLTRHLFQEALPSINAPVADTMNCVKHLAAEAGNDLAAGWVFSQFIEFSAKKAGRAEEVMGMALDENREWLDFICPGLLAGATVDPDKFVNKAVELCSHADKDIRVRAVFSLGIINYSQNINLRDSAIAAISHSVKEHKCPELRANAIKSYFEMNTLLEIEEQRFMELYEESASDADEMIIHAIAEKIFNQTGSLPKSILQLSADLLSKVNPCNKGTIDLIDITLRKLIDNSNETLAIELVENILISNGNAASINMFDSFISAVLADKNGFLDQLATRWLCSRSSWLCAAIPEMLSTVGGTPVALNFNPSIVSCQEPVDHVFLARKACGWLFMDPVSAGSFIVSIIEHAPDENVNEISEILMNPLLISYSGDIRIYLEKSMPERSEKIQMLMKSIFTAIDGYYKDLDSVKNIHEFLPSLKQREISRRNLGMKMRRTFKGAQEKSIISQIATKFVLLYGRKSIFYTHSLDGSPPGRQESVMHTFSHSIEHPALDRIDPHGLDHELRIFRYEGCVR